MISIRALKSDEGALLQSLRLGSLKDSPDSFSPLHEDFAEKDADYWANAAERIEAATGFEMFIAETGTKPCGLVSGNVDEHKVGHIGAMWASPSVRGQGIGKALLNHVVDYLKLQGCHRIELTVTDINEAAINLYRGLGFDMTGNSEPLRDGSTLKNLEMALDARCSN